MAPTGFVGLGNMGGPMAANIAKAGTGLIVFDKAGSAARAPAGTTAAETLDEVAKAAPTVILSVPDGAATRAVAKAIIGTAARATEVVIDLSTIGIAAAREAAELLGEAGIVYVDSPVSGGRSGALAGRVTVMWAGPQSLLEAQRPVLEAMAANVFHVGTEAGQGQAMKLLNNYLSATALAATAEAMVFGLSQGLDLRMMLDVVNVSTGRNSATADKFPNRVVTGSYDAGFHTALMAKDMALYLASAGAAGRSGAVGEAVGRTWREADAALPGSDITRIFDFVRDKGG